MLLSSVYLYLHIKQYDTDVYFLPPKVLGYADYVFTSVFTVEIVLKVTASDNFAIISSTLDSYVFDFVSSLPCSRLDDRVWSFSAHWLLLQKRIQPSGPAGGQRVSHIFLFAVSRYLPT